MQLAVDIGNSQVHLGLVRAGVVFRSWRFATRSYLTSDDLGSTLAQAMGASARSLDGMAVSSVVPQLTQRLANAGERLFGVQALVVQPGVTVVGLEVALDNPHQLGADRLVNSVAAHHVWPKQAVVVVDLGTATKVDAVSPREEFLGGAIAPGVRTGAQELERRTTLGVPYDFGSSGAATAGSTLDALRSGVVLGAAALVDGLVARVASELGEPARVVATGGLAGIVAPHCARVERVDPDLTLRGLGLLLARNRSRVGPPPHASSW